MLSVAASPSTAPSSSPTTKPLVAADTEALVLNLPNWGSPKGKSKIGGSRSGQESIRLAAVSPDGAGMTSNPNPTLYWYLTAPTKHRIEFALTAVGSAEPALELSFDGDAAAGLHAIDLSNYQTQLTPPKAELSDKADMGASPLYEWVIAVVEDPERRSHDVVAVGLIQFAPPDEALSASLKSAGGSPLARAAAFESANRWYDAFAEAEAAMRNDPSSQALSVEREKLLNQVGLGVHVEAGSPSPTGKSADSGHLGPVNLQPLAKVDASVQSTSK